VDNAADSVENAVEVWTGCPQAVGADVDRRVPARALSREPDSTPAGRPRTITGRRTHRLRAVHDQGPVVHGLPVLPRAGPSTASTSWWRWRWD